MAVSVGGGGAPDLIVPTIAITTPTANPTLAVSATPLTLGGTAGDNVGVTQVSWTNDRGGSGNATGTTAWSAASIPLLAGANVLTVTARDAAGNLATDVLTVTYTPSDVTVPTVTITSPTANPTLAVSATPVSLGGTAGDNVGVTQVSWTNDRGGSGVATGTTAWSVASIALLAGANVLTVTARDAAGNLATDVLTVTYTPSDATVPTVAITTPTANPTITVSATPMTLGGTAGDNVGVTQVSWANDRGGSGVRHWHHRLVCCEHRVAGGSERPHRHRARRGRQPRHRRPDRYVYAVRRDRSDRRDHDADRKPDDHRLCNAHDPRRHCG